jgi:hypothetical protein
MGGARATSNQGLRKKGAVHEHAAGKKRSPAIQKFPFCSINTYLSSPETASLNIPSSPAEESSFVQGSPEMSPPIAAAVPGAAKDYNAESTLARLLGSGMSLVIFEL